MEEIWDFVVGDATNFPEKTEYYMPLMLLEEANNYNGQILTADDPLAQLLIHKCEHDIPIHDMPDELRSKIIELRSEY